MNGTTIKECLTLDIKGMAELMGISDDLAYKIVHRADFPSFRVGRKILVDRRKLEAWLDRQSEGQISTWR